MSMLVELWNDYWWVLLLLLPVLCALACMRTGRRRLCPCCQGRDWRKGEDR